MDFESTYEEVRKLQAKTQLTKADKSFVDALSKSLGLEFYPKSTKCESCYSDQIIILSLHLKKRIKIDSGMFDKDFILKVAPFKWRGKVFTNEMLTNELANEFIKANPKALDFIELTKEGHQRQAKAQAEKTKNDKNITLKNLQAIKDGLPTETLIQP